jgi:serine/threonine-protein kinase
LWGEIAGRADLSPGTTIARYRIEQLIGQGGMGAVYGAVHLDLKKPVAIKILSTAFITNQEAVARFLREGEAASRIRHPHVVDVTDVGMLEGRPYLVMERLVGESLAEHLARQGAASVEEAIGWLLPTISAVQAGHDAGIIHRDLKPHNIFLERGFGGHVSPKVLDFGVSKIASASDATLTNTGSLLGTVCYMSPEQARGAKDISPASDQYALGLILSECLTGQRVFPGDNSLSIIHLIVAGTFAKPTELRGDLPAALEEVVLKALAIEKAARFASLREFGRALLPFADPRVRLQWEPAFATDGDTANNTAFVVRPAPGGVQATAVLAATPAPSDGERHTRLLDAAPPASLENITAARPPTTLSGGLPATSEKGRRPGRKHMVGAAVAVSAALALAFTLLRSGGEGQDTTPTTQMAASPAPPPAPPAPEEPATEVVAAKPEAKEAQKAIMSVLPPGATVSLGRQAIPLTEDGRAELVLPEDGSVVSLEISRHGYRSVRKAIASIADVPARIELRKKSGDGEKPTTQDGRGAPMKGAGGAALGSGAPSVAVPTSSTPSGPPKATSKAKLW